MSTWIRKAWTAFAADGDPGWPAFDGEQRLVQLIDTRPTVIAYPEETSRLLWHQHTFGALAVDRLSHSKGLTIAESITDCERFTRSIGHQRDASG